MLAQDWHIIIPQSYRVKIIRELYDMKTTDHSGVKKIVAAVFWQFYWPNLVRLVVKYMLSCKTCTRVKAIN